VELLADWKVMALRERDYCLRVTEFSYTLYLFVSPNIEDEKTSVTSVGMFSVRTVRK